MKSWQKIEEAVSAWPGVSVQGHRFGGREFCMGNAEIGHTHPGGVVDIPFPRSVRDALLADGLAEEHHWVPNSGWITFRARDEQDLAHALWLLRLSYLRYALKNAEDPRGLLEHEAEALQLTSKFRTLLEPFVSRATRAANELLEA